MNVDFNQELRAASEKLDPQRRASLGQFMTPMLIAEFMASLFQQWPQECRLLDPGAGIGSLTQAFARRYFERIPQGSLHLTAYEVEAVLLPTLAKTVANISASAPTDTLVNTKIVERDFIREVTFAVGFGSRGFTHVILNPPYKKIRADSDYRKLLRLVGVETGNLYTAFLAIAVALTDAGGEIVAILPRSFCNGTYFRPFRKWLLARAALRHIHVFESRNKAFGEDDVLQENIIIHLEKGDATGPVTLSTSHGPGFEDQLQKTVTYADIVKPGDEEQFIHVPTFDVASTGRLFTCTLDELGLDVATGPVVDFRLREHLLSEPRPESLPLLYAHHFTGGELQWPKLQHKKPNALLVNESTNKWLMPRGWYAVTKRFSAKEERRRIVSYVVDPRELPFDKYGFENHLNVVHAGKAGIEEHLARGMAVFLNSTIVDQHFRNFSGHTQVNATDLRAMKYPDKKTLIRFGKWAAKQQTMSQEEIDVIVEAADGNNSRANQGSTRPPRRNRNAKSSSE